jgi:hypothetical protein
VSCFGHGSDIPALSGAVAEPLAELTRAQPKILQIKLIQMKADARDVLCFYACIPDINVKKFTLMH